MSIYKDCDIRGIYGPELTDHEVYLIGRAFANMVKANAKLCVGGDVRLSTPALKAELIRGLTESGLDVDDIGTIPTPALYFALSNGNYDAGMTVTASHNPPKYNGIKFMIGDRPVTRETIDRLHDSVKEGAFPTGEGSIATPDLMTMYKNAMIRRFKAVKPLHVLVDAGNGAMSTVAPEVFRTCGYRVTEMNCVPDGSFPNRSPNPSDFRNIVATCEAVKDAGADFSVAFDGDGDRAVFIDDKGRAVNNEKALVLFVRRLLKDNPSSVVYDQKSSSIVRQATLEMGGTPIIERSGHAFIKKHFLETNAAVAGEVSGHFFFGDIGYDDGLYAALLMAEILGEGETKLSDYANAIVTPPITPDLRIYCPYDGQMARLSAVEAISELEKCEVSHLDGVRLEFEDGWVLVRKSVTAEEITVRAEANTEARLLELVNKVADVLPKSEGDELRGLMA